MTDNPNRTEAERLLGIAEKLLGSRDLNGSREFAILAQETEPLLEGSDQILAIFDVLIAAEKRVNNHHDWYSILQLDRRSDNELIRKQYRRLALLLHPDKNKFSFADQAFKLVADAWAVLSDSSKKMLYDSEMSLFSKIDLSNQPKLPVRKSQIQRPTSARKTSAQSARNKQTACQNNHEDQRMRLSNFWTICPYCYNLYEYPRVYEGCCLRCQNCQKAFHAALVSSLPPFVPGQEAYYCCWSFFPLGYTLETPENVGKTTAKAVAGFPNWMPPMFAGEQNGSDKNGGGGGTAAAILDGREATTEASATKKRGRPRKNAA
ncbi:putative dnajc14 protein [Tripterygium wilfordii]|uniref:Putative dnajc14 protein n=2 Tax=Tripterygium wilfordii TaxID=458696 RepID=A0A7J7DK82_TRIWF|nr:putative dnajc14 protein [Tripterygium wilfordii]